ncbi:MAG: fumarate reductase cytochrome b subunit [Campylobacteraceae bacterium]|jgi:fumarate reductase subunit C|nr:fumarate reductase cytochrome b subunit [Campylobacteraceae bacterium]
MNNIIEGYLGKRVDGKKSRLPAKLDFIQSATGLFLGLFMWGHMFFVATILISEDALNAVAGAFEGSFLFSEKQPLIVSFIVFVVFCIFVVHACLGMRKLPINFRQYQIYKAHASYMKHNDTSLWFWQAKTGFIMFFLGSAHLIIMMTNPAITAEISGGRMYSHFMWPFYLILLLAVELHGGIGLYRLCVKWGWFEGKDAKETRKKLSKVKWTLTAFFLALGLITLLAYVKVGYKYATQNQNASHIEHVMQKIDTDSMKARI